MSFVSISHSLFLNDKTSSITCCKFFVFIEQLSLEGICGDDVVQLPCSKFSSNMLLFQYLLSGSCPQYTMWHKEGIRI